MSKLPPSVLLTDTDNCIVRDRLATRQIQRHQAAYRVTKWRHRDVTDRRPTDVEMRDVMTPQRRRVQNDVTSQRTAGTAGDR